MFKPIFAAALGLLALSQVQAAAVFKCVDAKGKVTFTQQSCPDNHDLEGVVSSYNQPPSGSSAPTQMAAPRAQPISGEYIVQQPARPAGATVNVVGGSAPQAGCSSGLSDRDLRTARVKGEVVPGMSRGDVESMYGKPNGDSARGAGTSTYWNDKYVNVTSVSYDSNGCVRSSYLSGPRKK